MKIRSIGGLSDTFERLPNAIVVPLDGERRCGVLRQDGEFCEFSRGIMSPDRGAAAPVQPGGDIPQLSGRHLFGGWIRPHFGHFLLESTPRLWILDELSDSIDSIIFIPYRFGKAEKARDQYKPFLDLITDEKPVSIIAEPTRIEELIVPDPGFGHGIRITGSPRYRSFFRARVAASITPKGPERLYISRTLLRDIRGGVFAEARIEALMQADGYTIFHPQKFSTDEQLAHYRAAREIVCLDGSALHMVAYAARPGTRIAMILRRRARLLDGLVKQLEVFAEAEVHRIDALRNSWVDEGARRVNASSIGELDLPNLQAQLQEAGFLGAHPEIRDMTASEIETVISELKRGPMRPVAVDSASG